jgi:hypothetical protein
MSGIKISIFREGVSKENRSLAALDPAFVQLNDRSIPDLLDYTRSVAKEIAYYNILNLPDGDWSSFFDPAQLKLPDEFADQLLDLPAESYPSAGDSNASPHYALFLTFLALLEKLKMSVNTIPKRHFDFFINEVLHIRPKPGIPDKGIVLLELPNNGIPVRLPQGTPFSAGKGFDQQDIIYKSEREIIVNKAIITDVRTSFRNKNDFSKIFLTATAKYLKTELSKQTLPEKGWLAFGDGPIKDAGLATVPASTGWAIESPALYMQEGERSVFVDVWFDWLNTSAVLPVFDVQIPVDAYVTTSKGWMQAQVVMSKFRATTQSIVVEVKIPASFPVILPATGLPENIDTKWPLVKIVLNPETNADLYNFLQHVGVKKFQVTATVNGIKNLAVETSAGSVDPTRSFLPFGPNPALGSKIFIGLNELRYKNIKLAHITYKWKKAPKSLGLHYREYFSNGGVRPTLLQIPIANDSYKASVRKLINGEWTAPAFINLFPSDPAADEHTIEDFTYTPAVPSELANGITPLPAIKNAPSGGYRSITFDMLVNNSVFTGLMAFGQDEYPTVLSEIAIGKATLQPNYTNVNIPNAPYTPEIDYIFMNYEAIETFDAFPSHNENRFYHVAPFGIYEPDSANNRLIPQHEPEGFLYLGVEQLTPPQNLSILFRIDEKGTDKEINPDYFSWSYLAGNKWITLNKQQVVIDQTFGLKTSGIVELSIPAAATNIHTAMPAGKHWIKLAVAKDVTDVNPIIDLQTQAVRLVYAGDLINKPGILPAESIKMIVGSNGQIKSVKQPYPTSGGQDTESSDLLQLRTHERLRHRDRMINYWDYERLVLGSFPQIYKTKTLPCTENDVKNKPGHVTIVVIPDQRGNENLEPKCSQLLLSRITAFMEDRSQPGIQVHAVNPTYEKVYFDFYVSFMPGLDTGYYQQQLNKELQTYVSPWAFDRKQEIYFGSVFYKTDIIRFIDTRPYVDYVSRFEMYSTGGESAHYGIGEMEITASGALEELDDFVIAATFQPAVGDMVVDDNFIVGRPVDVAVASSPSGILVTAPKHRIRIIESGSFGALGISGIGIGSMAVEIDFIIP